jgi:hypothetical protein
LTEWTISEFSEELKTMTGNEKSKVVHASHADPKSKAQKAADKVTRATEKMHTDVTASLDQIQHPVGKTGAHKAVADAKKAPPKTGSPGKKMQR